MEALLKHLVDITCQRDHALLDRSVVAALHELVNARQVRVHELFRFRDEMIVRPRAWVADGKVLTAEENPGNGHGGQSIVNYPALMDCVSQRKTRAEETAADGSHTLWLPIWLNDKISTCLEVAVPGAFNDSALNMVEGILSVYRNFQHILDYSERDSLTGLLNRKTFDEKFSRMLLAATAESAPQDQVERRHQQQGMIGHWLAVVDIDHFKRVNDQFGHLYGDEVLLLVANLLRTSFRSLDRVFRFGGEEFVVLLRSTTLEDARKIFERFRRSVEQHDFPQVGRVTVSLGFTSIIHTTPVVVLGHADQALYYAKENGRNRVCYYDELVQAGELRSEVSNDTVEFF